MKFDQPSKVSKVSGTRSPLSRLSRELEDHLDLLDLLERIYELQNWIQETGALLNTLQDQKDHLIEHANSQGITDAGNYALLSKETVRRKINVDRFKQTYPDQYKMLYILEKDRVLRAVGNAINVADAERLLSKDELTPVCDLQVSVKQVAVKKQIDGREQE